MVTTRVHLGREQRVHEPDISGPTDDRPNEECGVLGISTPHGDGVAQMAFFGLFALQHRGQEAAGIAVSDGRRARVHKDEGLVANVFTAVGERRASMGPPIITMLLGVASPRAAISDTAASTGTVGWHTLITWHTPYWACRCRMNCWM